MSVVPPLVGVPAGTFGSGGDEPWARVLTEGGGRLWVEHEDGNRARVDTGRFLAGPDDADRSALGGVHGPVLDVGCGPGRMVRAALDAGLPALGIDVAAAAVRGCRAAGLPVLRRDVFGAVPRAGEWGAVLLIDGNVGIGGDVHALLARCRSLLAPGGSVVAEVHGERGRDERTVGRVVDAAGRSSAPFPWASVGELPFVAAAAGFREAAVWTADHRRFVRLDRTGEPR